MEKIITVDEVVRLHGVGKIKMVRSFSEKNSSVFEKEYSCKLLTDMGSHIIKLSMPVEYGETVTLPLDCIYDLYINTESSKYYVRGIITKRYRDELGNVMEFKMTQPLSLVKKLDFPTIETNIQASYSIQGVPEKKSASISKLSIKNLTLFCEEYIEEGTRLDIVFSLGRENIILSGEVNETLRLKFEQFESSINLLKNDYTMEEEISKWMLNSY